MKVNTLELVENLYKRCESVLPIKNYFGLLAVYARAMAAVEADPPLRGKGHGAAEGR